MFLSCVSKHFRIGTYIPLNFLGEVPKFLKVAFLGQMLMDFISHSLRRTISCLSMIVIPRA